MITDLQYTDCRYIDTAYPQTNHRGWGLSYI